MLNVKSKYGLDTGIEKYNYLKSIKDKETKVLEYYKRIHKVEQPKIHKIPKPIRKLTKKAKINIDKKPNDDTDNHGNHERINMKNKKLELNMSLEQAQKKLTQKQNNYVVMD